MSKIPLLCLGMAFLSSACKKDEGEGEFRGDGSPRRYIETANGPVLQSEADAGAAEKPGAGSASVVEEMPLAYTNASLYDASQPDFIGSCVVRSETLDHCFQSKDMATLFFCEGEARREFCDPKAYEQTCTMTLAEAASSGNAKKLAFSYFLGAQQDSSFCDSGSLGSE